MADTNAKEYSKAIGAEKLLEIEAIIHYASGKVYHESTVKLPSSLQLPPHKKTRTETAEAYRLVPPVKTVKRKHVDAYSAGEKSGKHAKHDAL